MTPKVQSILSYIGILWLVAYFAGKEERNDLSRYHLKQGLGLLVASLVFNILIAILLMLIPSLATMLSFSGLVLLILMILGIIAAANEAKKPLPVIGKLFEDKFEFIDK